MAGSYKHCVAEDGQLYRNEDFVEMIENLGDAYEAVEEMYGMIWLLATEWSRDSENSPQPDPGSLVEYARERYRAGLVVSPGVDGRLPRES